LTIAQNGHYCKCLGQINNFVNKLFKELEMQLPLVTATTVDLDSGRYETLTVGKKAVLSKPIAAGMVYVTTSTHIIVDAGAEPDADKAGGLITAGSSTGIWLTNPDTDFVSIRTVDGSEGVVTLYYL
jgi:hypothetical protein